MREEDTKMKREEAQGEDLETEDLDLIHLVRALLYLLEAGKSYTTGIR